MTAKKWLDRGVYLTSMALTTFINRRKDIKSLSFSNILCIKEDEIGDFIYTLPVYEMLRKQFPAAQITVLCRPFGKQILKYCPHVNAVFSEYADLKGKYDLIIDLRGTIPSTFYALKHPRSSAWTEAASAIKTEKRASTRMNRKPIWKSYFRYSTPKIKF
jgi:ADP-heptose:LPS heptosyltransferase